MKNSAVQRLGAAAGVAAGLLASAPATAVTVYTQSDFSSPASDVWFVALVHQELHRPPTALAAVNLGGAPAGPHGLSFDIADSFDSYAIIGVTSDDSPFVSFSEAPFGVGEAFETVFAGIPEPTLVEALKTGFGEFNTAVDQTKNNPRHITRTGFECQTTHFSVGSPYGPFIASFTPVPEPSGSVALLAGSWLISRRRRANL